MMPRCMIRRRKICGRGADGCPLLWSWCYGKKRDIKYHATPESLQSITELQRQIVAAGWQYVKPHGVLLYSTCTIHRGEIRRWQSGSQRISRLYWKKRDSFCRERMRPTDSIMQDCAEKRER